MFIKGSAPDTLSLPAGIAPSLLLAKGKVTGAPAHSRVLSPQLQADIHLHHIGHPPASPTSGGRRGGRWTMGWLRVVLRDPVSRRGPRGWAWSQELNKGAHLCPTSPPQTHM